MKNIGFVENDDENIETIKFLVDSAKGIRTIKMTKEAHPMTDETTVVVEDVVTEEVTPEAPTEEVTNVEVAPETEATVEVEKKDIDEAVDSQDIVGDTPKNPSDADAEPEIQNVEKSDDEAVATAVADIKDSLTNAFGDLAATVKSISDQVAELSKSLSDVSGNIAAVNNKVDTVASEVSNVQGNFNEFGKRVDKVEADTAFRKSGDLGEIVQEFAEMRTHKSLWGGSFLKSTDLFKR
jgi:chromosome segregation ATPase